MPLMNVDFRLSLGTRNGEKAGKTEWLCSVAWVGSHAIHRVIASLHPSDRAIHSVQLRSDYDVTTAYAASGVGRF